MINCPEKLESVFVLTVEIDQANTEVIRNAIDRLKSGHILLDSSATHESITVELPTYLKLDAVVTIAGGSCLIDRGHLDMSFAYKLYTDLDQEYVERADQKIRERDAYVLEMAPDMDMHLLHKTRDAYVCRPHFHDAVLESLSAMDGHGDLFSHIALELSMLSSDL